MNKKPDFHISCTKLLSITVDLLTVGFVFCFFVIVRKELGGEFNPKNYFRLWPFLLLFWLVFEKLGLYSGTSIHSGASLGPVEEIRRTVYAVCGIFIMLGFGNYCYRPDEYLYSRTILIGTCLTCLILLPLNRFILRKICVHMNCWGVPAIIIGSGDIACKIFENMRRHPEYGLIPVGFFTDHKQHNMPSEAIFMGGLKDIPEKSLKMAVKYAILAKEAPLDSPYIQQIINEYGLLFPHLLLIPKSFLKTCSGIIPKDISGILGLEIRHNLQIPAIYQLKNILDYALTLPCLIAALPVMGLIAILIKLDSPGPVTFKHRRITKNGRYINIYKFRTMVDNAQGKLHELLNNSPEMKQEWGAYGKLTNDPRITQVGHWLRETSLDELPQLFNVLQGKMTLVGPRPLIAEELEIYGETAAIFNQVLPGLTGLWQVSGRNELTYKERAKLDLYYVNNWSVWLDIYILAKTVYTVFFRFGAK